MMHLNPSFYFYFLPEPPLAVLVVELLVSLVGQGVVLLGHMAST